MPKGKDQKPHIGIFSRRNVGKSSFINVITGSEVAIVSDVAGTTTDPVKKSIEIFGIGPAIIVDTAGIDDIGALGEKRIRKTMELVKIVDCAVLLIAENNFGEYEINLIRMFNEYEIPFLIIHNKKDIQTLQKSTLKEIDFICKADVLDFSSVENENMDAVVGLLKLTIPQTSYQNIALFDGLINDKDIVILVTPIDSEAPDGRMILPQVMAIRDVLDHNCINVVLKETELEDFLKTKIKPRIVITDSQAFAKIDKIVPKEIPLTGFSILFARLRGNFEAYLAGTPKISHLKEGDKILILESCTHHVSCDDIGRHKIPNWLSKFTGKNLEFEFISGFGNLKNNIKEYALVIQCGGCVFTKKQVLNRLKPAIDAGIPVTNYGMMIAFTQGIYERTLASFST
ncbi:MAG: [FeFe] hydrogenase H-cluster maturation GTPase HydF [Bacteroidetes bacterium RIFOXYB2_FULL_35_7]|nr:MAG: [FeFe] hydrogenase H-cluster maturation GTPase HydF [Bacteroidetes bacterium RIFOXYB2_FULL_35_7]